MSAGSVTIESVPEVTAELAELYNAVVTQLRSSPGFRAALSPRALQAVAKIRKMHQQ